MAEMKQVSVNMCELCGPYECPSCGGHMMIDGTYLDQVSSTVDCLYCGIEATVPVDKFIDTPVVISKGVAKRRLVRLKSTKTERQKQIVQMVIDFFDEFGLTYGRLYMEERKGPQFVDGRAIKFFRLSTIQFASAKLVLDIRLSRVNAMAVVSVKGRKVGSLHIYNDANNEVVND